MALTRAVLLLALPCLVVSGHVHVHGHHVHHVRHHARKQNHPVKLAATSELTPVGNAVPESVPADSTDAPAEPVEAPAAAGGAETESQPAEQEPMAQTAAETPEPPPETLAETPDKQLEQVKQEMAKAESDRAKIGILEKSLETQQLLVGEGKAVMDSFQDDAYAGDLVKEQQEKMKEMVGQTEDILEHTKKTAVEESTDALSRAKAVLEASLAAEKKAEQDIVAARQASQTSSELMKEAQAELDQANGKQQPAAAVSAQVEQVQQAQQTDQQASPVPAGQAKVDQVPLRPMPKKTALLQFVDSQEDSEDEEDDIAEAPSAKPTAADATVAANAVSDEQQDEDEDGAEEGYDEADDAAEEEEIPQKKAFLQMRK